MLDLKDPSLCVQDPNFCERNPSLVHRILVLVYRILAFARVIQVFTHAIQVFAHAIQSFTHMILRGPQGSLAVAKVSRILLEHGVMTRAQILQLIDQAARDHREVFFRAFGSLKLGTCLYGPSIYIAAILRMYGKGMSVTYNKGISLVYNGGGKL